MAERPPGAARTTNDLDNSSDVFAYLGPQGTFSHAAARRAAGEAARTLETATILGVFDAVGRGEARYGVVPVENSSEGGVAESLTGLLSTDAQVLQEITLAVSLCLLSAQTQLKEVERVYSHPQPLGQCRAWLERHLPRATLVPCASTAHAAEEARGAPRAAAIASRLAGELRGLGVIQEAIEDRPGNATRFFVLGPHDAARSGQDRTSLVFTTEHQRGALLRCLTVFDAEGINLTRIESRPFGERWEYAFFVDLEGHREDAHVARALNQLKQHTRQLKLLGSYPRSEDP